MRAALFATALLAFSACADDTPTPKNLVFIGYDGFDEPSTVAIALSIDLASDRVTLTEGTQPAFTATLTAEAHAQIDIAERQVEETWDPAEPCPTCRLYPESFHFNSDQGPVSAEYGFVEAGTNVDQLRVVVDALVLQLRTCHGGNFIAQCFEQP